jgi:hypothetical protein
MNELIELSQKPELAILSTHEIATKETIEKLSSMEVETVDWKSMSMLQRSQILHEALSFLEDATDEEFELILDVEEKFKEKLIGFAYICQKFDKAAEIIFSEAEAIKNQVKEMERRAEVFSNRSTRMRELMRLAMLQNNLKKVETPMLTVSLRKKPQRVVESSNARFEDFSPDSPYVRTSLSFNKKEIANDLKRGQEIKGFQLSEPEFSLTIR